MLQEHHNTFWECSAADFIHVKITGIVLTKWQQY